MLGGVGRSVRWGVVKHKARCGEVLGRVGRSVRQGVERYKAGWGEV